MEKISVIVPIYNAEKKYLTECVDSIIGLDYKNIEVILVDDGSTNSSGEVCDGYADKDERIQVIHQKNQGVSVARNTGIDQATGEWIAFVDVDDWLEKNIFSEVMGQIKEKKTDLVVWNMYMNYSNVEKVAQNYKETFYTDSKIEIEEIRLRLLRTISIYNNEKNITTINYPFCHLYQKKIIQQWNVRFDSEFKQGEDKLFNYQYFTKINSILYINKPLYHYRQHSLSVSHKFYKEHEENTTRILKKYYEIEPLIQSNKKYKDTYNIRTAYLAWWLIRKYYLHENSTVKKPLKEFENMLKSSPYSESIKKLNVADMKFSLTKIRLILLKLHMNHLLFLDAKIEMKLRAKNKGE